MNFVLEMYRVTCPKCGCQVMDPFTGQEVIHDVDKCRGIVYPKEDDGSAAK